MWLYEAIFSGLLHRSPASGFIIEKNTYDPGLKQEKVSRATKGFFKKGIPVVFAVGFVVIPFIAEASFVSSAFNSLVSMAGGVSRASEIVRLHISSETPALRAAVNLDPNPAKGGGDITVVGGVALQAETGPSGTLADIEVARPGADQISIYVVREGDTLSQIADLFGVSTNTIVWGNDLKGSTIRPGQTLAILPVSGLTHTVKKGDTIASIVKKYQGDVDEVLTFNNLSPGQALAVGDKVVVPYGIAPQSVSSGSTKAPAKGSGGPTLSGYFLRPVVGGMRSQGIHGYNGVDLAAPGGSNVLAAASGEVIISRSSGYNGGYGQYIVVKHGNGTQTLYAHLSQNYVYAGTEVVQGQVIGAVGSTGRSTGNHLHFEVRGAANPF